MTAVYGQRHSLLAIASFLLLAMLAIPLLAVPADAAILGCCKPNEGAGECFIGEGSFPDQGSFTTACAELPGTLVPGVTTCNGIADCVVGCCCATSNVPNSAQINEDEAQLSMTKNSCTRKTTSSATYQFKTKDAPTCVAVCGGTPTTGGGTTHTVSGVTFNATGTKALGGVNVFVPIPNGYISNITDPNGLFTLRDVPQINTHVFAIHPNCRPGQSQSLLVDKDISAVRIDLNCQLQGCAHTKPALSKPKPVRGTDKVIFTITFTDTCTDLSQFEPLRCDSQFKNCIALQPQSPSTKDVTDTGLTNDTTYCYTVRARFGDGTFTDSGLADNCVKTGSLACMGLPADSPTSWCGMAGTPPQPAVLTCDDNNQLKTVQSCSGKACAPIGAERTPACVEAADCQLCNGIYGFFARLGLTINVGGLSKRCGAETPACYLETTQNAILPTSKPLLIDAYSSCSQVTACAAYGKKESCESNACGIGDGTATACEWKALSDELGKGICTKKGEPACSSCAAVLGYCDAATCAKISPDCYYDGENNGLAETLGCVAKSEMACRYYDTKSDCVGSGAGASYDIQYSGGVRSGTTNRRTASSADKFGIGACTWVEERTHCVKNADGRFTTESKEDDCIESNVFDAKRACVRDSKPPTTTLYLRTPAIYARPEVRTMPFSVQDDTTPVDRIRTYLCFKNATNNCYPNETMANIGLPQEGSYELRYYSMDENDNIEQVQTANIMIKDYHQAALDKFSIEENPDT